MHRRNQKCAGMWRWQLSSALTVTLTEGGFPHKEKLSRVPEKGKMPADRLLWNPRGADKILDLPVS